MSPSHTLALALGSIGLGVLAACPPPAPPGPVPPDASDAAPMPPQAPDAAPVPPPPSTPCGAACVVLTTYCGTQQADCERVMSAVDGTRLIREPSGRPLSCRDIAAAKSAVDVRALGAACP
jgi:hypothetical protein